MKNEDLIQEIANELNLPFEDVKEMIVLAFEDIKYKMKELKLRNFRFKWLGSLQLFPGRIKGKRKVVNHLLAEGRMEEETHKSYIKLFDEYDLAASKGLVERQDTNDES